MSTVKQWAAISALVLAVLLIVVVFTGFGPEDEIVPEVSVSAASGSNMDANASLKLRTELQKWREISGPAPAGKVSEDAVDFPANIEFKKGVSNSRETVTQWQKDKPDIDISPSRDISGISSLPYLQANRFEQPGGRTWRRLRNDQVSYGGGVVIFGIGLALALFLFFRGRIGLESGFSGKTVERFKPFERANHWMTATAFILMAITGLIILYGKPLLLPLLGHNATGSVARASAWLHMASAVPFVIGVVMMTFLWIMDNIPRPVDWTWLKQGGGFIDNSHPPAQKFNAGQKIVFWGVTLGGFALLASGLTLMFPFFWFGYDGMQLAQISHAVIGLLMIVLIIGHIYIGTVGMRGAFDAMWSGYVDRNWAKEHHSLWYQRITGSQARRSGAKPRQTQAAE